MPPLCTLINKIITLQNCDIEPDEFLPNHLNPTPPPLIPISMLNAQNSKPAHQTGLLPTLQLIPKSNTSRSLQNVTSKIIDLTEKEKECCDPRIKNKISHYYGNSSLKPAQNIGLITGKRYIIVPKNNDMAVQPPRTLIQDKFKPNQSRVDDNNTFRTAEAMEMRSLPSDVQFESGIFPSDSYSEMGMKKTVRSDLKSTIYEDSKTVSFNLLSSTKTELSVTNVFAANTKLCQLLTHNFIRIQSSDKHNPVFQDIPITLRTSSESER